MEYNVILKKRVRATHDREFSGWDVFLQRRITLPFVPSREISLQLEEDDPELPESITWDFQGAFFEVWLPTASIPRMLYLSPSSGPDIEMLREYVGDLVEFGWSFLRAPAIGWE